MRRQPEIVRSVLLTCALCVCSCRWRKEGAKLLVLGNMYFQKSLARYYRLPMNFICQCICSAISFEIPFAATLMTNNRFRGRTTTTIIIIVWGILLSARAREKRVANICSVCALAGEKTSPQKTWFWDLFIFKTIWPGKSDFRSFEFDNAYAVKSVLKDNGGTTTKAIIIMAVWAISSSARGRQKRVANVCSVCALGGEEKKTQTIWFWELFIFRKVWLCRIDFWPVAFDNAYAVKSCWK